MTPASPQHTFAIMAFKGAPYLEEAVRSILNQTLPSRVYMTTSTPTDRIRSIAGQYGIPLHINEGRAGIVGDWEFALSLAETPLVTLADQDDRYDPAYARSILAASDRHPDALILFTGNAEIDEAGRRRRPNRTSRVKDMLLWPFLFKEDLGSRFWKRAVLCLGDPICSPSVTYNIRNLGGHHLFDEAYAMSLDWDAWLNMADKPGSFCYVKRCLLEHRIHRQTQTSGGIAGGRRAQEDLRLFQRLWPKGIARLLAKLYASSYGTNT